MGGGGNGLLIAERPVVGVEWSVEELFGCRRRPTARLGGLWGARRRRRAPLWAAGGGIRASVASIGERHRHRHRHPRPHSHRRHRLSPRRPATCRGKAVNALRGRGGGAVLLLLRAGHDRRQARLGCRTRLLEPLEALQAEVVESHRPDWPADRPVPAPTGPRREHAGGGAGRGRPRGRVGAKRRRRRGRRPVGGCRRRRGMRGGGRLGHRRRWWRRWGWR